MHLPILDVIEVTILSSAISQRLFGFGGRMNLSTPAHSKSEANTGVEDLARGHAAAEPGAVPALGSRSAARSARLAYSPAIGNCRSESRWQTK